MAKNKETLPALRFNSWTLGSHGADVFDKSAEALELERLNPLRGVDEWRLGQIFDDARDGVFADIAWLYNEIEGVEPALSSCCDMRESAASECGWLVQTSDARRVRGYDEALAEEQRDALLAAFGAVDDDLAELAGHLVSAFFRGAAHALPLWNEDGSLAGFRHLDLWNFALDKKTGLWYWNADASRDEKSFQPIAPGELVSLAVTRHVDHAALPIFIRAALGAKRYGVWLDRFGIPPVGIIMPPTAEKSEQAAYMDLARKFARGGSGILPNASSIVYGTEARAVCPFTEFIKFQQQQIYTVGIGRVQSGESGGDNLGGNAAGVVETGFRRIVRRDARRIARAINDGVTRKILARLFPGRPVLAQFAWDTDEKRTCREVLEDAGFAKNAGLEIDMGQLQELTGYKLSKAPEPNVQGPFGGLNATAPGKTPLQNAENALQNAPSPADGQGDEKSPDASEGILEAFAKDTSKAAEAVKALLADPTPEKAEQLLADLPNLLPDDPALAAVIAEAMAAEFRPVPSASTGEEVTNTTDAQGNEHDDLGRFTEKGNGSSGAGKKDDKTYGRELEEKLHRKWLKQWDEVDELNDLFDKYANADGEERERAGDVMRKKFAELKAKGIVERNPKEGRAFRVKDAPSREYIMKDDEWERTGRQKYNDPTQRLSFVDLPDKIANNADECRAEDPAHCRTHGAPVKAATEAEIKRFLADPPARLSPDMADALLSAGFDDRDGDGNTVKYGSLLKDHLERESHSEKDRIARKQRLGEAVKVIRTSKPMPSKDPDRPNERVYSGLSNGKAYIGISDEHGELNAIVMVSYRRDGRHDEK